MKRVAESPPSTFPLCEKYLADRGITLETALFNGVVRRSSSGDTRVLPGEYRQLLDSDEWNGVSLQTLVKETLWFSCRDHRGVEQSVMVRFFPELPPKNGEKPTKFLTPKGGNNFPFITQATWDVADDIKKPIMITEGAPKALAILQAGGLPIALSGVWMGTVTGYNGKPELHKALRYFKWEGRIAYLVFDADFAVNKDVRQALVRTGILLAQIGADVRVLIWEAGSDNKNKGVDDLLYNEGPQILGMLRESSVDIGAVVRHEDLSMVKREVSKAQVMGSQLEQLCNFFAPSLKVSADTLLLELGGRARDEGDDYKEPEPERVWIEFLSPSQIKAYVTPPGTVLVGDNHIVRGSVFVVGGAPGVGKSRAGTGLAEAGATLMDWLGQPVHCNFRTLIIQNENGMHRLKMEFKELNEGILDKHLRISPPPPFGLRFDKLGFRDQLKAYIETWDPAVMLIDPWNAVARDDKVKDYRETFDLIRDVVPAGDLSPAIGIFPHTRKPLQNERCNGRALLNLLAGSYILASIRRTVWILQHASDDVTETRVVVTCCKNNDGELGNRSVWTRENGLWTSVAGFDWTAWDNGEKQHDFTSENVAEILAKHVSGLSQSKLAAEIVKRGVKRATAYRRIDKAEKSGEIRYQKGKDVYVLP